MKNTTVSACLDSKLASIILLLAAAVVTQEAVGQQYRFQQLNPPNATYSFASGINNNNVVVGSFTLADGTYEGFAYKNGVYKTIVFPGAVSFTQANGINDSNLVVGAFTGSDQLNHGFLVTPNGKFSQYDVASGASTNISGVNNAGSFVGNTSFQGATVMGFINVGGSVTEFTFNGNYTFPFGVNNKSETVGFFIDTNFLTHGFFRDAAGSMQQIDYPDAATTVCLTINDLEEIAGYYVDHSNVQHAFATKNGKFMTGPLPDVAGINNSQVLVGSYIASNQLNYGFLATPAGTASRK